MPSNSTKSSGGIRHNDSSNSLASCRINRIDSSGSLASGGISHNDSTNSLQSMTIDISDTESLENYDSPVKVNNLRERSRTLHQSCVFTWQDPEDSEDSERKKDWENANRITPRSARMINKSQEDMEKRAESIEDKELVSEKDLLEDNCETSSACDIAKEWVTTRDLVKVLANYPNSMLTLLQLMEMHGFMTKSVRDLIACNNHIFTISGEMIDLRPEIALCLNHVSPEGCQNESSCEDLHICPKYLALNCAEEECSLGHKWNTNHNAKVLSNFSLQDLSNETLRSVIEYTTTNPSPTGPLEVCDNYNESTCGKSRCKSLHICKFFLAGRANCYRLLCPLNHSFSEPSVHCLLETHGLTNRQAPKDIVHSLFDANPDLANQLPLPPSTSESDFPVTIWSTYITCGDIEIPEICYNSVEGKCVYEESGCKRLHCDRYFHWQVKETDGHWFNLVPSLVTCLELAYCNPAKEAVTLPRQDLTALDPSTGGLIPLMGRETWTANFENDAKKLTISSGDKVLELRRLCSEDIGEFVPGRDFLWYYENSDGKYIEYGSKGTSEDDDMSDITSQCLEDTFQNHLKANTKIHFGNTKYTYYLDVNSMSQVNEFNKSECKVRRRPKPHLQVPN